MGSHALLSASASKRWLTCTPSARLEEPFPNESSVFAEEGTAAHLLCEYKIRKYLHDRVKRPTSEFDSEEMESCTDIYAELIISEVERMKESDASPLVLVEEKLDYSYLVPSGFGTGDCVLLGRGILHVFDYKNGKGVRVDADHNPQMMLYALGALHAYGYIFDIHTVLMTIVQPRLDNISTFECSVEELNDWAENYVRPRAKLAYEGKGEQVPGDHCRFCRAKPVCRACAEEAMGLVREEFLDLDQGALAEDEKLPDSEEPAERHALLGESKGVKSEADEPEETDVTAPYNPDTKAPTFLSPGLLTKSEIEEILPTLNRISSWIESVFAYVSCEAINHGTHWEGYKVVEGRSNRRFTDIKAVVDAAAKEGYTDVYKQEIISLTEFEKLMGKKRFNEILGKYVVKPPGKLSLVPESDERPAVDLSSAADEFETLDAGEEAEEKKARPP